MSVVVCAGTTAQKVSAASSGRRKGVIGRFNRVSSLLCAGSKTQVRKSRQGFCALVVWRGPLGTVCAGESNRPSEGPPPLAESNEHEDHTGDDAPTVMVFAKAVHYAPLPPPTRESLRKRALERSRVSCPMPSSARAPCFRLPPSRNRWPPCGGAGASRCAASPGLPGSAMMRSGPGSAARACRARPSWRPR